MATTCRCHLQIHLFDLLIFAKFRVAHFAKINHTANLEEDLANGLVADSKILSVAN